MSTKSLLKSGEIFPAAVNDFFKPWNEWFDNGNAMFGKMVSFPAVNVTESPREFSVSLAAPGLKREDFKIDVEGNMLTISSEIEEEKEAKDERYTKKEYHYSSFSRSFTLPEGVTKEKIDAIYENGVLRLVLPKSEETKKSSVKHIAVK